MQTLTDRLLDKVVDSLGQPLRWDGQGQDEPLLLACAARYSGEMKDPKEGGGFGFDADAAALFEAIVEGAYLVAHADGVFDATEQQAFGRLVWEICGGRISEGQLQALVQDLGSQLREDGLARRLAMVAKAVVDLEHRREALRVAALLATVSAGVSEVERDVLLQFAQELALGPEEVGGAIANAQTALASTV